MTDQADTERNKASIPSQFRLRQSSNRSKYPMDEMTMTKACSKCGVRKSAESFVKNKAFPYGRGSCCKECDNAKQRKWRATAVMGNPGFVQRRLMSQKYHRARKYGLTVSQLDELIVRADGRCEICGNLPTKTSASTMSLHVDHCHTTGKVRGMLCSRCNTTIGGVGENIKLLQRMQEYLMAHAQAGG